MASEKRVLLQGGGERVGLPAKEIFTPGHLIEIVLDTILKYQKHSTAGGSAMKLFALENYAGGDSDDNYAAGDQAQGLYAVPGSLINALIANGEDIAVADWLESNGDGALREVDADASFGAWVHSSVIGQAEEAIDTSDSSGADPTPPWRCAVRIR
jgi:hypothetical protein